MYKLQNKSIVQFKTIKTIHVGDLFGLTPTLLPYNLKLLINEFNLVIY